MKIYTSYFENIPNIPSSLTIVAICYEAPENYNGKEFKLLAPSHDILHEYHHNGMDEERYTRRFYHEILSKLNAQEIYLKLKEYVEDQDCVLLCYEKREEFCHRHLVADWLMKELNIEIKEL